MRMRKKKHLDERLEGVSERLFVSRLEDRNFNTAAAEKEYLDFDKWFGRPAPLFLEIGCGKGGFAVEYALQHPEINFLAVEKQANVIVTACEEAEKRAIPNLRFIKCSAEYLPKYIPPHSVERIFLNFSCPFPKNKYASHRLTHSRFLAIYKELMAPGAVLHQKTDNADFFAFSLEELSDNGFTLKNISLDLHHSDFAADNIETEYEHKFASQGLPIYRLEAYLKGGVGNDRFRD